MNICQICVFLVAASITETFGQLSGKKDPNGILVWTDAGSGADKDFSTWMPNLSSFNKAIYNHGQTNLTHLTNPIFSVEAWQNDGWAVPTGFDKIWSDVGSGADTDVTFWRMVCPSGYVSLGDVTYPAHGDPPAFLYETYRCIKRTLVYECFWGADIWTDRGSGADNDLRVVGVSCPGLVMDEYLQVIENPIPFEADHFYAVDNYDQLPSVAPYGLLTHKLYYV